MSRLATPIRKNDNVLVVTGKDRGKRGRVLKVVPDNNRLIVEGVNLIKRHTKPNPGRTSRAASSSARRRCTRRTCSWCARSAARQTRIGHKILGDGRKVRICRKCEGVVDK